MKPIQSNAFRTGFLIGIIGCVLLNYYSFLANQCPVHISDCGSYFGFPVKSYSFVYYQETIWLGLVADIFFAVTAGFLLGLVFRFVRSKLGALA